MGAIYTSWKATRIVVKSASVASCGIPSMLDIKAVAVVRMSAPLVQISYAGLARERLEAA